MAWDRRALRESGASMVAALVLLAVLIATVVASIRMNGVFIYALDDAYIHMAMAKNVAQHGVWGVTRYEFSSASSSPLFTALLSLGFAVFGPNELLPLVLNLVAAVCMVLLMASVLRSAGYRSATAAVLALMIALLMPMAALILGGMEHAVHSVVALAFVVIGAKTLGEERAPSVRQMAVLCAIAVVAVLLRYESMAILGTFVVLAMLRRRWVLAVSVLASTVVPVVLFGIFSITNGGFFLPNSLVMKMRPLPGQDLAVAIKHGWAIGEKEMHSLVPRILTVWVDPREAAHMLPLLAVCAAFLIYLLLKRDSGGMWSQPSLMLLMGVVGAFAHIEFGDFGWLFRYEAYLIGILYVSILVGIRPTLVSLAKGWAEGRTLKRAAAAVLAFLIALAVVVPSVTRAGQAQSQSVQATKNIHDQQYQMARFVSKYYTGKTIVASDIGAITYFGDFRLIDLSGLGSTQIARTAKGKGALTWGPDAVATIARAEGAEIAFTFAEINKPIIPTQWKPVAAWRIEDNVICADDAVTFYAVQPSSERRLRQNMRDFAGESPIRLIAY